MPSSTICRGIFYRREGFNDEAIADYTKAIEINPNDARAYNNRGWTYHLKGEDAKGLPDAEKAVALAPKEANCFGTRAEIYEKPRAARRGDRRLSHRAGAG